MNRRRAIFVAVPAILLGLGAWYHFNGHQAPIGQSPLEDLNAQSLDTLKSEFNRASSQTRVILLLSPT